MKLPEQSLDSEHSQWPEGKGGRYLSYVKFIVDTPIRLESTMDPQKYSRLIIILYILALFLDNHFSHNYLHSGLKCKIFKIT